MELCFLQFRCGLSDIDTSVITGSPSLLHGATTSSGIVCWGVGGYVEDPITE